MLMHIIFLTYGYVFLEAHNIDLYADSIIRQNLHETCCRLKPHLVMSKNEVNIAWVFKQITTQSLCKRPHLI